MKLSEHFTLKEATLSQTALKYKLQNVPNELQLERMQLAALGMEKVRELLGSNPIKVNSWFRGPEVNAKVGGVPNSQHARGEAIDFTCSQFGSPREICKELMKHKLDLGYDQLILEPGWVHISFIGGTPRGNELTFLGKNTYAPGIA